MNWILFNANDLPVTKVLAANFDHNDISYREKFLGTIQIFNKNTPQQVFVCHDGPGDYWRVTHYIDIDSFDL